MSPQHHRKKGGERKYGRAVSKCKIYRMLHKRERSHLRRLAKHQKVYKDFSPMVLNAIERYQKAITKR